MRNRKSAGVTIEPKGVLTEDKTIAGEKKKSTIHIF